MFTCLPLRAISTRPETFLFLRGIQRKAYFLLFIPLTGKMFNSSRHCNRPYKNNIRDQLSHPKPSQDTTSSISRGQKNDIPNKPVLIVILSSSGTAIDFRGQRPVTLIGNQRMARVRIGVGDFKDEARLAVVDADSGWVRGVAVGFEVDFLERSLYEHAVFPCSHHRRARHD